MNAILVLKSEIEAALPHVACIIENMPVNQDSGVWFMDVSYVDKNLEVQWQSSKGFGISEPPHTFGTGPDQLVKDQDVALVEILKILNST